MNNGCRKNMRERNWPLSNLSATSASVCVRTHIYTRERKGKKEDVNKVYTHVHRRTCTAGELQRTDSKEWIDERTVEQMARARTFSLFVCRVYSTCIDTLIAWENMGGRSKERERERAVKKKVIDAESLHSDAQRIATAQILSLRFFLLYTRRWRPEDSVRRRRRRWEFSFFSLHCHPQRQVSQHTGHTHLNTQHFRGIEEHERDPGMLWIFRHSNSRYAEKKKKKKKKPRDELYI